MSSMLSVARKPSMLSVIMQSVVVLNVAKKPTMLSVIMLSVVILNVVARLSNATFSSCSVANQSPIL